MSQSLRAIKSRIKSVDNTRKITKAMEMVSSVKFSRIENSLLSAKAYFLKLDSILKNLDFENLNISHPFFEKTNEKGNITVCVITSDTGLCANFNNHIIKTAENFLKDFPKEKISLVCVGKKSFIHFRRKEFNITHSLVGLYGRFSEEIPEKITSMLIKAFFTNKSSQVYVIYANFQSKARNNPVIEKIFNIDVKGTRPVNYIIEPDIKTILDELLNRYILAKVRMIVLDSFASEHSTRMIAMEVATKNALELIENLIILRNRVRQATITKEVLEIASASEALKIQGE